MKPYPYLRLAAVVPFFIAACAPPAQDEPATEIPAEQTVGFTDEGPERQVIHRPGNIDWQEGPASFEHGAQFAVLEGDPAERGVFNMRIKMPDGFRIAPHRHPNVERVTVLSGTFRLGHGEELDAEGTEPLEAGSYFALPSEMPHYAITEGETIIQLSTIGPWEITYVNPEDDPRSND